VPNRTDAYSDTFLLNPPSTELFFCGALSGSPHFVKDELILVGIYGF